MSSSKATIDLSEFINPEFKTAKYFPIEEEIDSKTEEIKQAWREIFAFAYDVNRAGRPFTDSDVQIQTERYCTVIYGLSMDKVRKLFQKVFDNNKDEYGIIDKPEIIKVEVFLRKYYDFANNEVTQMIEAKRKHVDNWEELNVDSLYRKLQHVGFKFGLDKLKSLVRSDFVPNYNPFLEHFNKLPKWDGVTDHIDQLSSYVTTTENDFFKTQFKKYLVRCIGCSLYGKENRTVFTLIGEKQHTGKSTFIRFLNPFPNQKYYTEAPIRNNKDSEFSFSENFFYNLEELSSLNNNEVNRMKAIISTSVIKERKAYAVNPVQQPRRCNFIGSANKDGFLTDTENTRWIIAELVKIDWNYKTKININDVWAQAFALYHDPEFNDQLTQEEADRREAINKNYEVNPLEKELLRWTFKPCWKDEGAFYSNADLFKIIQSGIDKTLNPNLIGTYMSQLGFEKHSKKINGSPVRGWWALYVEEKDRNYTDLGIDVITDKPF